jgi:hypothetical protein
VPQKAQSKLNPSSDFSVRLYRVSGKAQQEHNQLQKEGRNGKRSRNGFRFCFKFSERPSRLTHRLDYT